jgi:hypothetical protein
MFLWQVEFWLAKNLLLKLQGSRAVYFIWHRKSIIVLTYCLCCVFHLHCNIRHRKSIIALCDLFPKIHVLILCFSYNKDIFINVRTFRSKCYQSRDVIYPVLKGSVILNGGSAWRLTKPLPFKTGYITSLDW